jgi:hypothetical protein
MKTRNIRPVLALLAVLALAACGTLTEIKNATQLIKADNELALMITSRDEDTSGTVKAQLVMAGDQAFERAQSTVSGGSSKERVEAISWYRIAATAYWQSGETDAVSKMFQAADAGRQLCTDLGAGAPDRDCVYLKLLIPFAAFEASSEADDQHLLAALDLVNFREATDPDPGVATIKTVHERLLSERRILDEIEELKDDAVLANHPTLKRYYEDNRTKARTFFDQVRMKFLSRLVDLKERFPAEFESLGITIESVKALELSSS